MQGLPVLARLALRYHIPRIEVLLKAISLKCVSCQRAYARVSQQKMGELPAPRVNPARPFSTVCVNFAGPVSYKEGNLR